MEHSNCGWTCECAGKTVRSLENTCHTWALLRWCFMKRRYIKCTYLYLYMFIVHCCSSSMVRQCWLDFVMDAEQMNCLHLHHLIPRYGIHTPCCLSQFTSLSSCCSVDLWLRSFLLFHSYMCGCSYNVLTLLVWCQKGGIWPVNSFVPTVSKVL